MIQRIQSIYLLLAAILMAVTAFSPIFNIGEQVVYSFGIKEAGVIIKPTWGIVFAAGLSSLLSLITIFLFKNRKRQSLIATVSAITIILFYVTALVYMLSYYNDFFGSMPSINYAAMLPALGLIFVLLSKSKIKKDEKLVRSLDRIR